MSLVSFHGVAFDYAGQPLLDGVSFGVERADRWGVIGRNGSGKTTLFRLLVGQLEATRGSISRESALRVALLDQHRDFGEAATVWDAAAAPFADLSALEASLEAQAHALADDASPQALARYDEDLHRFDREGGHTFRATVDALLEGLGFNADRARTQSTSGLSGGERGRLGLVRQLAQPADLLLLDEPTNHLDLETTRWLEGYLLGARTACMAISHDRAFLDRIADHILHIEAGTAFAYDTSYVHFVELRTERREAQQRAFDQQQRKIAAEEDYIRRNIAGQNSRQAKGRRKRLSRLPRLSPPPGEEGTMAVRLSASARGGDQVMVLRDVRLEIDGLRLLEPFSARVTRGEVIGIVGPNGAGKSTLLHAITGERPPAGGQITIGAGITVAHYRQDLAQVPAERMLFQVIHDLRPRWERGPVQSHLGRFGFSGEEVHRIAGSLSGGEQARLALAMIVLSGANLLLFDEPTNHLDVESIEALEDAIDAFDGTILLVSHDRALLETLTTRTWALYDRRIMDHHGPFDEWDRAHAQRNRTREEDSRRASAAQRSTEKAAARRQLDARQKRTSNRRALERAASEAEARAHAIEANVAELTRRLHDPGLYQTAEGVAEAGRLSDELRAAQAELDRALQDWADAEQRVAANS